MKEEEGGEAFEDLPDRPISPHPNFVTPEGLASLEAELSRLHEEHAAAQAAVILAVGVTAGGAAGGLLGALVAGAVPFTLSLWTFLLPPVGVFLLGMCGALVAMHRVSTVDPHLALGASA